MFVQDEQRQLVFFNVVTNEVIKRTLDDGTSRRTLRESLVNPIPYYYYS